VVAMLLVKFVRCSARWLLMLGVLPGCVIGPSCLVLFARATVGLCSWELGVWFLGGYANGIPIVSIGWHPNLVLSLCVANILLHGVIGS